ncbi:hypothetical protein EON68_00075 [archaeon]|nr:MAG: hypothetical protein EON68_00075 [archaeon]
MCRPVEAAAKVDGGNVLAGFVGTFMIIAAVLAGLYATSGALPALLACKRPPAARLAARASFTRVRLCCVRVRARCRGWLSRRP